MLKVWQILQQFDEFKHCLFIPCDSHGLQLLIKDLLDLPVFKKLHDKIQNIVNDFKNSPLQYARLQECQRQKYGRKRAICISVITRWGTQFRLVNSIHRSKEALRMYAYEHVDRKDMNKDVIDDLLSSSF
jgi:hypothetical protein